MYIGDLPLYDKKDFSKFKNLKLLVSLRLPGFLRQTSKYFKDLNKPSQNRQAAPTICGVRLVQEIRVRN